MCQQSSSRIQNEPGYRKRTVFKHHNMTSTKRTKKNAGIERSKKNNNNNINKNKNKLAIKKRKEKGTDRHEKDRKKMEKKREERKKLKLIAAFL